jgi:cobalamin-dependent methionine synthase I
MIGGASQHILLSKLHRNIEKIHVNDASRAVTVAGSLLNKDKKYMQVIFGRSMMRLENILNRSRDKKFLDH